MATTKVLPKDRSKALAYYHANRERRNAAAKEWNKQNPGSLKAAKERAKAKEYGLTVGELRELLSRKVCGICEEPFPKSKHRHIDHCHETGKVRGLLCSSCNLALGMMKDSPERLRKGALYLEDNI